MPFMTSMKKAIVASVATNKHNEEDTTAKDINKRSLRKSIKAIATKLPGKGGRTSKVIINKFKTFTKRTPTLSAHEQDTAHKLSNINIPYSTISDAINFSIDIGLPRVQSHNIKRKDVAAREISTTITSTSTSHQPKSSTHDNSTPHISSEDSTNQATSETQEENTAVSDVARLSSLKKLLQTSQKGRGWLYDNAALMASLTTTLIDASHTTTNSVNSNAGHDSLKTQSESTTTTYNQIGRQSEENIIIKTTSNNDVAPGITSLKETSTTGGVASPSTQEHLYQLITADNPPASASASNQARETCITAEQEPIQGSSRALIKFHHQSPRAIHGFDTEASANTPDHLDSSYPSRSSSSLDDVLECEGLDELAAFNRMIAAKIEKALHTSSMINWGLAEEEQESLKDCNFNESFARGWKAGDESGFQQGQKDGYESGMAAGQQLGATAGFEAGDAAGYKCGKVDGYEDGYEAGHAAGLEHPRDIDEQDAITIWDHGFAAGREDGSTEGYAAGFAASSVSAA